MEGSWVAFNESICVAQVRAFGEAERPCSSRYLTLRHGAFAGAMMPGLVAEGWRPEILKHGSVAFSRELALG